MTFQAVITLQVQVSSRRCETTPFDVVDERWTMKFLGRACALTFTLLPVVVYPVVVVVA